MVWPHVPFMVTNPQRRVRMYMDRFEAGTYVHLSASREVRWVDNKDSSCYIHIDDQLIGKCFVYYRNTIIARLVKNFVRGAFKRFYEQDICSWPINSSFVIFHYYIQVCLTSIFFSSIHHF